MATATKDKATTKKATKKATDDLIVNVAHEVENMDKEAAFAAAESLEQEIEFNYFKLGGVLARIHIEQWYLEEGHEKFPDFIESRFGIRRSKAFHLIGIYNGLVESGVSWEDVKDVGWTKLKELVNVITPKNVKAWVKRANEMTLLQLIDYIKKQHEKAAKSETGSDSVDADESEAPAVTTLTFKVHDDQKDMINQALDKAKVEANTQVQTVALEAICMGYLAGESKPKEEQGDAEPETPNKPTQEGLKNYMENFTWEDVLGVFEKIWPDVDITVETD